MLLYTTTTVLLSPDQNAFIKGRQILDGSLIANEVIDSWQKRGEKGIVCKLDIEKAYDSINWQFLLKVMQKMGFGSKWIGWMWYCISTVKYSVLVNGVPAGFFSSTKGLRQGDPLSPYLFIMGMEVLSVLITRAAEGDFIKGCRIWRDREQAVKVTHLLFADDTIIFCEAKKEALLHLGWVLFWFEAASGLKINLDKSMVIPVGEVDGVLDMAAEIGCRVGQLPTVYLGLPLGAPNRDVSAWDGVEERTRRRLSLWKRQYLSKGGRLTLIKSTMSSFPLYQMSVFRMPKSVARRIEKLQRDFLWGGANGGTKSHLVKWEAVCVEKEKGGLGLRKISILNKALLGKWIWRFACAKEELWKKVLEAKYGKEEFGWRTRKANGAFGVGVWKEILKESTWCWENMGFKVGKGSRIRFWTDLWCGNSVLSQDFPNLFSMAAHRNVTVEECWDQNTGQGGWILGLLRDLNDWEVGLVGNILAVLRDYSVTMEDDAVCWKKGEDGLFKIKYAYNVLANSHGLDFPHSNVWVGKVPTKIAFFAWEATWGKVLTLDRLQRRGWHLPNRCFLCGCEEETINHILIHCTVAKGLWNIILALCGVQWVFPNSVKEVLSSWKGSFVGRKRKEVWKAIPLFIFWNIWKERNRLAFKGGVLDCQKLKTSLVYIIWGWAKVYINMESKSLIDPAASADLAVVLMQEGLAHVILVGRRNLEAESFGSSEAAAWMERDDRIFNDKHIILSSIWRTRPPNQEGSDLAKCATNSEESVGDDAPLKLFGGLGMILTITRSRIEASIPRKHGPAIAGYEAALNKFFENVLQAFLKYVDFNVVRCAVIASPGFTKVCDNFVDFLN
ncbi:putative ribonuclease H protein [Vitis vinifera]|uniref:Putative ribonuclease H protein n=1 Tax=Vitis vinifera TaxID=29760 RepID=A0A438JED5_VITVI|nr:putative ribonuclease H protein [Vitis vinifera]